MPEQLPPFGRGVDSGLPIAAPDESATILLHAEAIAVSKKVRRTLVRAATSTSTREEAVEADLERVEVVIERVRIDRIVEDVPPVRTEGDVTILPVVEEELVLVRRLVLKEEVRIRTVRTVSLHTETVSLRQQNFDVTRTPLED